MKKYFVKYLPVEGELESGDITKLGTVTYTCGSEPDRDDDVVYIRDKEGKEGGYWNDFNIKKLKLFLCSRDIQVGDKISTIFDNRVCHGIIKDDLDKKWLIESSFTGVKIDKDKSFKVIGEISLDAIWVTEGMEFDEDEINIWAWDGEDEWNFSVEEWLTEEQEHKYDNFKIEIKCPTCKTYH